MQVKNTMEKFAPLVRKLARKRRAVNNIFTEEDLEQEAWINIIKYWDKPIAIKKTVLKDGKKVKVQVVIDGVPQFGPAMKDLPEVEIIKNITTIFDRKVIDIIRSQARRPDTHWSYKSNVLDPLSKSAVHTKIVTSKDSGNLIAEEFEPDNKKKYKNTKTHALPAGAFTGTITEPYEALEGSRALELILDWIIQRDTEAQEELSEALEYAKSSKDRKFSRNDISNSQRKADKSRISRQIVEELLDRSDETKQALQLMGKDPDGKLTGKDICGILNVPISHWARTLKEVKQMLQRGKAA
jgi:hypothetical protein